MQELLPHIDIAICSDDFVPPDGAETLTFLQSAGVARAAVSRGSRAIQYMDHQRQGSIPVAPIKAVDTLGAGDVLHGAFCKFIVESPGSFIQCLTQAAVVASLSCRHFGTREWMDHYPGLSHSQ